jgi:Uma2 family endonuclease
MASTSQAPATLDDLYKVDGKAELIGGRIAHFMASGYDPSLVALELAVSLRLHSKTLGVGKAFGDGIGYALETHLANGRQSFSPDASFYVGPPPTNRMRFVVGKPIFAVEVRSENDYGEAAEAEMEAKRADYFEAGTLVVWDVDPEAKTIASYRGDPAHPVAVFGLGQVADAEPAVPDWRLPVDEIFVQA